MLFKKIVLPTAILSIAGLVACGDDSSSNSGNDSKELPKSVPTFFDLEDVDCNADLKCKTIIVEDGPDTYECDGENWNMLINSMPSKVCPAEEENGEEGKGEEGDNESEGSEEGGNNSEGSEEGGDNGGSTEVGSSASAAESTSSNADSASSGEGNEGGEELTGPTGDVVSCLQEISMMGVTTQSCSEIAADSKDVEAMKASCQTVEGFVTATLGTACPTPYTKKCVVDNENAAYFYEEANASENCADLVQKN